MREVIVEEAGDAAAKRLGFEKRKLKWIGRRAAPDKAYSHPRTGPFLVEYKRPGGEPRLQQEREIARLRKAGWTVYVIDNVADAVALFEDLLK